MRIPPFVLQSSRRFEIPWKPRPPGRAHRRQRFRWLWLILFSLGFGVGAAEITPFMEESAVTGESAEIGAPHTDFKRRFKLLLESPPALEQLLFREKLPPRPNQGVPMDHGIHYSTTSIKPQQDLPG